MKKPKSSPAKAEPSSFTTPKRRSGKSSRSTPNRLGRSTTPNSSNESSPRNFHEESCSQAPVDLDNLTVDEFLCSQDVVNSDVTWDCSSPRSRLVPAPGGSDVESLVKLFRTKPQEIKPVPSAFSIISTNFSKASGSTPTTRRKKGNAKKKASSAAIAQAALNQMHELWDIVQQSKKNGFGPAATTSTPQASEDTQDAATAKSPDVAVEKVGVDATPRKDTADTLAEAEDERAQPAAVIVVEDEDDYDMLLMGDDSILVAATQEMDASSPARKYSKTPTRANRAQTPSVSRSATPASEVGPRAPRKTPPSVSPARRQEDRSTPNPNIVATRKSPRLSALSLNRTPSPLRPPSVKTKKAAELVNCVEPVKRAEVPKCDELVDHAEPPISAKLVKTAEPVKTTERAETPEPAPPIQASSRTSSTDLLFEDDDEDELLDQICCTYEQQQQVDAKMAAAAAASSLKSSTSSTVTPTHNTASAPRSLTIVSSVASKTSAVLSSKTEAPKANVVSSYVSASSLKTTTSSTVTPVHSTMLASRSVTVVSSVASKTCATLSSKTEAPKSTAVKSYVSASSVRKIDQPKGSPRNIAVPAQPVSSVRAAVSVSAVKQSSNSTNKPVFSALSNATNQPKPGSTYTGSFQQPRVILERCAATSAKAPLSGKGPPPSTAHASSSSKPCSNTKSPLDRPPVGTVHRQVAVVKTVARSADAALDFDDDDSDLATPEVMSWLEEIESQPVQVKRCTPEEIAKKRAEALRRRRLREQESNMWKGRLRMSK
ncbi:hypothetical protein HPB50_019913 [Hyalomma asiaticum]|uniref:Uncharacterized protein n=1 Tax=Hyalomma asiaticum TaxID=266040 RepID=A0ACB7RVS2_HYAAI|nr:hypothetical protein HPB50_019913 [Hyalomma asiaticum]